MNTVNDNFMWMGISSDYSIVLKDSIHALHYKLTGVKKVDMGNERYFEFLKSEYGLVGISFSNFELDTVYYFENEEALNKIRMLL